MSTICQSCLGADCIDLPDDSVLYSIQGDQFLFVVDCPAGFDCNGFRNFGQVSVQCCDELLTQAYEVPITTDAYNRIVAQLVAQCAARLPFCSTPTPPVSPGQPVIYYYSHPASCTVKCPQDGIPFEYTVPPGAVIGTTQAQADAGAHRIACNLATLHRICLSGFPKTWTVDLPFSKNITATGGFLAKFPQVNYWQIVSGALPTGLTFNGGFTTSNTVSVTGTPTVVGDYTFTVQITDPYGDIQRKTYNISIIGTPPNLPSLYWEMEEASGSRIDQIHSLALVETFRTFTQVPGIITKGINFQGGGIVGHGEQMDTGSTPLLGWPGATGFSITAWIKFVSIVSIPPGNPIGFAIIGDAGSAQAIVFIADSATNDLFVNFRDSSFASTTFVTPSLGVGNWHFIAITYDVPTFTGKVYFDAGAPITQLVTPYTTWTNGDFQIGEFALSSINIDMDEVGYWDGHVLTPTEITAMFNGGAGARPPGV